MLELPMQDAWQAASGEILGVAAQRAGGQVERAGGGDEVFEGGALHGDREAAAQGGHVGIEAVMAGDHGETGEAAFGDFGLADEIISEYYIHETQTIRALYSVKYVVIL